MEPKDLDKMQTKSLVTKLAQGVSGGSINFNHSKVPQPPPLGKVNINQIDDSLKVLREESKPSTSEVISDDDEDEDEDEGDVESDLNISDSLSVPKVSNQSLIDHHVKDNVKTGNVVLTPENKPLISQPIPVKDVKIPTDVDFGIDKIANKDVLDIISGDERDDDDQKGRKMFQHGKNTQKQRKIPLILNRQHYKQGDVNNKHINSPLKGVNDSGIRIVEEESDENYDKMSGQGNEEDDEKVNTSASDGEDEGDREGENKEEDQNEGEGDQDEEGDEEGDVKLNHRNSTVQNESESSSMDKDSKSSSREGIEDSEISENEVERLRKKPHHKLTRHEITILKRKELALIERLDNRGYKPSKQFTMVDNLDEIISERKRLDYDKGCATSIKFQRKILMMISSGIEFVNSRYDPFDLHLDGWSESIYENIEDYDEVFEELYQKYRRKVKVAPEIKLLGMVAGSAIMFHFSKSLISKASDTVPGFEEVMRDNPQLKSAYEQAAMKKMAMGSGGGSGVSSNHSNPMGGLLGTFFGNPGLGNMVSGFFNPSPPRPSGPPSSTGNVNPLRPPMSSTNLSTPISTLNRPPAQAHGSSKSSEPPSGNQHNTSTVCPKIPTSTPIEMTGPNGVDNLLRDLTQGTNADLTEMQLSDVEESGSLSDLGSNIRSVSFQNKRTTRSTSAKPKSKINLKLT